MKVRFRAMGTSPGPWIDNLKALEEFGKADEVSEVEVALDNGPVILIEEVIDSLTKDQIITHLTMVIRPHDAPPTNVTFSPCVLPS